MKKMMVMLLAAVWLTACSMGSQVESTGNNSSNTKNSVAHDTARLVERVNEIYTYVSNYYEYMKTPQSKTRLTGIKPPAVKYCSRDWNDWVTRVNNYDAEHDDGMEGFFEADYWIMGQDWDKISVSDVSVASMTDSTAVVNLNLHNFNDIAVRLEMVLERDEWKIDNFIDVKNDLDWKAAMKEYLNSL